MNQALFPSCLLHCCYLRNGEDDENAGPDHDFAEGAPLLPLLLPLDVTTATAAKVITRHQKSIFSVILFPHLSNPVIFSHCLYSVSTNFRLPLLESSARKVEGQQFFLYSSAVSSLCRVDHVLFISPHSPFFSLESSPEIYINLSSRRLSTRQAKITGHAITAYLHKYNLLLTLF